MNHGTGEHVIRTRVMNILQPGKDSPHVAACRRYLQWSSILMGSFRFPVLHSISFPIIGLFFYTAS
jgi:hypothetical protein